MKRITLGTLSEPAAAERLLRPVSVYGLAFQPIPVRGLIHVTRGRPARGDSRSLAFLGNGAPKPPGA